MSVSSSAPATASSSVLRPPSQRSLVRVASTADEVDHADALGSDGVLRQQAEGAGHLP